MRRLLGVFNNLLIVHKLLLTSAIPIVALILLSLRRASERKRLIVEMESVFSCRLANLFEFMVQGRENQRHIVETVQRLVKRLITEKDQPIQAVQEDHQTDALHALI